MPKFIKSIISLNEMSRNQDIVTVCWERERNFYNQNFREVEVNDSNLNQYGSGKYIHCKRPPYYDEDWIAENEATKHILIGSESSFKSMEAICAELTNSINKLISIYEKCEWEEEDYPADVKVIQKKHIEIVSKVKFSNRYVVE